MLLRYADECIKYKSLWNFHNKMKISERENLVKCVRISTYVRFRFYATSLYQIYRNTISYLITCLIWINCDFVRALFSSVFVFDIFMGCLLSIRIRIILRLYWNILIFHHFRDSNSIFSSLKSHFFMKNMYQSILLKVMYCNDH